MQTDWKFFQTLWYNKNTGIITKIDAKEACKMKNSDFRHMYEKSMQRLEIISKISGTIALGNTHDRWQKSLKDIVSLMEANIGSIYLLKDNGKHFYCAYEFSDSDNSKISVSDQMDIELLKDMPIMDLLLNGKSLKLDSITQSMHRKLNVYNHENPYLYKSSICSPIKIGSSVEGAIAVSSKKPHCFTGDDLKVLDSIGRIIGTAFYNNRLLEELTDNKNALDRAFNAANEARISERMRLSRELHDDIGQRLISLSIRLKAIQQEQDINVIYDRLNSARFLISGALEELKRILNALPPSKLEGDQMLDSLRELVHDLSNDSGIPILLEASEDHFNISNDRETIIYRCVQEGVNNIMKHSKASLARISLFFEKQDIVLIIRDNGIGLPIEAYAKGTGLAGMRDRVGEVNGDFRIHSSKTEGTTITVRLPTCIEQ